MSDSVLKAVPTNSEPIVVVSAADDNYAMPLAVTIRSAIDSLKPRQPIHINILDGGLTDASKVRLQKSWSDPRATIAFLKPDIEAIADLKTENHLNLVTYLRLFMPSLLGKDVRKVLFLDADLLILKNLRELWEVQLGSAPIAAINDYFTPYLNTREAVQRPTACDRHPDKCLPVPNYRELGLKPTAGYFNAGVMVVNLDVWREMDVLHRAMDLVRRYHEHVRYCDQYALNVLFSEKWKPLDPRWNQNSNLWAWRGESDGAFDPALYRLMQNDPWIVHFTWIKKPWHYGSTHPFTRHFFKVVDRTDWRRWRPKAPPRDWGEIYSDYYARYRKWYKKRVGPVTGALKEAIRGKKRAA
jgi:lipopolysaccharide biosynthesis glycosyltransferase